MSDAMEMIYAGAKEANNLTYYLYQVLMQEVPSMDPKSATPTGFANPGDPVALIIFVLVMFINTRLLMGSWFTFVAILVIGDGEALALKRRKFCESCRELLFYCISLWLSWAVFRKESWLYNPDDMWQYDRQWTVPTEFKSLYFFEASWYIAGIVSLMIDAKKKDFVEMTAHHAFTILLLTISYHQSHMRVGAVVFILHNLSDPFLQIAKLCKYGKMETLSTISFVGFMIVFVLTRLVYYPTIIYSCHFRGPGYFFNRSHGNLENLLTGLLTALYPIHCYWFFLIVKVAIKAIKGNINDSRSDSDEEEEATAKKTK